MRVLLAGRLSQLQSGQTGMESREREMVNWAKANDHEVVAITEDWQSGTTPLVQRKDLRPWVTEPDKLARFDALVAYEASRLSRGPKAMTNEIERWATDEDKLILTVREGLRFPCEGTEGIHWDVTHRVNHQQWLDTSRMYLNMQAHLRANGYLVGRAPFGYQIIKSGEHKTLSPIPALVPVIREMFQRYLDGSSLAVICRWLDGLGIKPTRGMIWSATSVAQIFRNNVYVGKRKQGRTFLRVEPIVDAKVFRAVNHKLDNAPTKRGAARADTLLTNVLHCLKCKAPMYALRKIQDGKEYGYYRCTSPSRCKNWVRLSLLDRLAELYMVSRVKEPYEVRQLIPGSGHDGALAEIDAELAEAMVQFRASEIDAGTFSATTARLAAQREEVATLPADPDEVQMVDSGETIGVHWLGLDTPGRRAFLLELDVRMEAVKQDGTLWVTVNGERLLPELMFEGDELLTG